MRTAIKGQGVHIQKIIYNLLKIIAITYIMTGLLLLFLALLMYKMDLVDQQINIGIMIIMILSTFVGGFLAAKAMKERRFIYGAIVGILYFLILIIISLTIHKNIKLAHDSILMFFICLGSGALGGMLG